MYFSDSIVRINYGPISKASDEVAALRNLQRHLFSRGILIRGGMTYGDIYYDEKTGILFGQAMNRAHELESKYSLFPRIIVDNDIVKAVDGPFLCDKDENPKFAWIPYFDYMRAGLPIDKKASFLYDLLPDFIPDLSISKLTVETEKGFPPWFSKKSILRIMEIQDNKEFINELLNGTQDERKLQKIEWLAKSHNFEIGRIFDWLLKSKLELINFSETYDILEKCILYLKKE